MSTQVVATQGDLRSCALPHALPSPARRPDMAAILSLVAEVVIGLLDGWSARGRRDAAAQAPVAAVPAAANETAPSPTSSDTPPVAVAESSTETATVVEAAPAPSSPVSETDAVSETDEVSEDD